jgi:hypothetical protein
MSLRKMLMLPTFLEGVEESPRVKRDSDVKL